jgi:hypothetical protein
MLAAFGQNFKGLREASVTEQFTCAKQGSFNCKKSLECDQENAQEKRLKP